MPAKIDTTCSSTGIGENCGCFSSSVRRAPRASRRCVAGSRSEANCAKAAISRYCASSSLMRAGDLLHRLDLRRRADAADREADVDGRADAAIEQLGLEEDLAVGDRDHVGRDIGRDVAGLGLDDRQRGQRARAVLVVHLGRALEQARMQIEHVAGIGFAARRAAQQQRHLAIGDGLLRQIVIDDHARACRCRGRTRPSRSRYRARGTAAAPAPTRSRRRRSNSPARRNPAAS